MQPVVTGGAAEGPAALGLPAAADMMRGHSARTDDARARFRALAGSLVRTSNRELERPLNLPVLLPACDLAPPLLRGWPMAIARGRVGHRAECTAGCCEGLVICVVKEIICKVCVCKCASMLRLLSTG